MVRRTHSHPEIVTEVVEDDVPQTREEFVQENLMVINQCLFAINLQWYRGKAEFREKVQQMRKDCADLLGMMEDET